MSDRKTTVPVPIPIGLARRLRGVGLQWTAQPGDHFHIPDRGLDDHVFTISDMVVEVREVIGGERELAFNGTVEWALDAIVKAEVVWLPDEGQMRELLGEAFVALYVDDGGFTCVARIRGDLTPFTAATPAEAYGEALLASLEAD